MSSAPLPPPPPPASPPAAAHAPPAGAPLAAPPRREITLISHSMLFYWWPIWLLGFSLAMFTFYEGHRLAILPPNTTARELKEKQTDTSSFFELRVDKGQETPSLREAVEKSNEGPEVSRRAFPTRVSEKAWMGPVFCVILLMTVVITNVPLRGLWSFLVLLMFVVIALLITLVPEGWDKLLGALGHLHIYINMAGYLFIAAVVFVLWAVSVFIFDQRTYVVVMPGQIRVCEHIGASIRTFDATQVKNFEKQRDDMFRHWLLGFFSSDLLIHLVGGETIRLPNVLGIGWHLEEVQKLLSERTTVAA